MLLKTKKVVDYEVIYKDILKTYFDFLNLRTLELTPIGVSEFLRYSLCTALGLSTISSHIYIDNNSFRLIQEFKIVLNKYDVYSKNIQYKQGLLEACVHCIELSRVEAGY